MRKIKFVSGEYYHIFNRGVDKRDVFLDEGDYSRFLTSMKDFNVNRVDGGLYRKFLREKFDRSSDLSRGSTSNLEVEPRTQPHTPPLVSFIAYSLLPNHYHFILRQEVEDGIVKFMQRLGTAYTMYFNLKTNRTGSLFQGRFKSVAISSNEDLLWVSAYVNANAQIHGLTKDAANYKWCSYPEYLGLNNEIFCHKDIISKQFKDNDQFKSFMNDCMATMKDKKEIQKYLFD